MSSEQGSQSTLLQLSAIWAWPVDVLNNLPPKQSILTSSLFLSDYDQWHQNENFQMKNSDIFLISAQNIDCGYSLEPPRWGGSNEYPQSMFLSRNKKNNVYPCKPQFYYIKLGFMGGPKLYRHVFMMQDLSSQIQFFTSVAFFLDNVNSLAICIQRLIHQGPVVQSVVSLTSSLRVISLTVLADSIHNILIFFAEKCE